MDLQIRDANPSDAKLLFELGRRTFHEAYAHNNDPTNLGIYMDSTFQEPIQAREISDPARMIFIGYEGDRPVGYAHLRAGPAEACVTGENPVELLRLYFERRCYGKGYAEPLLKHCFDRARNAGFRTIWLSVWDQNPRAIAFYRKWGFAEVGSHPFMVGPEEQTDLLLSRAL